MVERASGPIRFIGAMRARCGRFSSLKNSLNPLAIDTEARTLEAATQPKLLSVGIQTVYSGNN